MGIDALGRLIKLSPDIAEQHQLAVIDCMEVSDVVFSAWWLASDKNAIYMYADRPLPFLFFWFWCILID